MRQKKGETFNFSLNPPFRQYDVMHSANYLVSLNTINLALIKFAGLFGSFT